MSFDNTKVFSSEDMPELVSRAAFVLCVLWIDKEHGRCDRLEYWDPTFPWGKDGCDENVARDVINEWLVANGAGPKETVIIYFLW